MVIWVEDESAIVASLSLFFHGTRRYCAGSFSVLAVHHLGVVHEVLFSPGVWSRLSNGRVFLIT